MLFFGSCAKKHMAAPVVTAPIAMSRDAMLEHLATELRIGRLDVAADHFSDRERARAVLEGLNQQQREDLADGFRHAKLFKAYPSRKFCLYKAPFKEADGSTRQVEFSLGQLETGHWVITSW